MTKEPSGDVGQPKGLRRRSRSLCLFLALPWYWLAVKVSSWSTRSLRHLSVLPGAIHRRVPTREAALKPVIPDCLASERVARVVAVLKKLEALVKRIGSRYPWRRRVRQIGHCCQRCWTLAVARFRTGAGWTRNRMAGNRSLARLRNQCCGLVGQIGRSERMQWAPGNYRRNYRRVRRWFGRLAPYTQVLTSAWPSTGEITGEIYEAALAEKRVREPGVWVDSESPLGYTGLVRPIRDRAVYSSAGRNPSRGNGLWVDGDCPIGYARIPAEYFAPSEPELLRLPELEEAEVAEFQPDHFLLDLFRAYSQLLEQRGDGALRLAPVVPLVDVFALLSSVRSVNPDYSPDYTTDYSTDYTREDFINDVYRLHASGLDTTRDGARISFPISRGVKSKTLTVTDESGHECRYYGVRFLGQGSSG